MGIAVERQANNFGVAIDHRATRIATDDVGAGDKIIMLRQIEFALCRQPRIGQRVRLGTGMTFERTIEIGERRHGTAAFHPALDIAKAQAQRAGRVGIHLAAQLREARLGDELGVLLLNRTDFVFIAFADGARACIDRTRELNKRVGRFFDHRTVAQPQCFAYRRIAERCAVNQTRRHLRGRFTAQHLHHERIIGAQPFTHFRERPFELYFFKIRVDRCG